MTTTTMTYFTSGKFGTGPQPEGWDGDWDGSPPGYLPVTAHGVNEADPMIALYSQDDHSKTGPAYLIEISDFSRSEWFGTTSLRDAMDLLARWAPVITASILSYFSGILNTDENMGSIGTLPRLIARIRADEQDGAIDQAEDEILASRREQRRAWLADQAAPAQTPVQEANGQVPAEPAQEDKTAQESGASG